jgi:hypothetical protein
MNQKDFQKRDEIVFGQAVDWEKRELPPGCCERFENLDAEGIHKLLALGFMKAEQTMNSSPSVESFLKFASEMREKGFAFKFEGFAFDPREENQDVILEGIYYQDDYPPEIGLAFVKFVYPYHPDKLVIEDKLLHAWWD